MLLESSRGWAGVLYVDGYYDNIVHQVSLDGTVSAFGSEASVGGPAFDATGNLFVANPNGRTIVKITPSGTSSTFFSGLSRGPLAMVFDSAGNLYASTLNAENVLKITVSGRFHRRL